MFQMRPKTDHGITYGGAGSGRMVRPGLVMCVIVMGVWSLMFRAWV
jgi:hypothetical protein